MLSHLLAAGSQPGDNLVPLYYISAIIISVGTAVWALARWFDRQRSKWANEATHDAHLSDELRANTDAAKTNTEAAKSNTAAIDNLATRLESFAVKVETELNGHNSRISRLEDAMYSVSPFHFRAKNLGDGDDPRT